MPRTCWIRLGSYTRIPFWPRTLWNWKCEVVLSLRALRLSTFARNRFCMIVALGVDIIEIARIEDAFARLGQRFRDRIFTESEIAYCESRGSRLASYAARFAAKEAVMKALGTGWGD